jgi:hypothetical protein
VGGNAIAFAKTCERGMYFTSNIIFSITTIECLQS